METDRPTTALDDDLQEFLRWKGEIDEGLKVIGLKEQEKEYVKNWVGPTFQSKKVGLRLAILEKWTAQKLQSRNVSKDEIAFQAIKRFHIVSLATANRYAMLVVAQLQKSTSVKIIE